MNKGSIILKIFNWQGRDQGLDQGIRAAWSAAKRLFCVACLSGCTTALPKEANEQWIKDTLKESQKLTAQTITAAEQTKALREKIEAILAEIKKETAAAKTASEECAASLAKKEKMDIAARRAAAARKRAAELQAEAEVVPEPTATPDPEYSPSDAPL